MRLRSELNGIYTRIKNLCKRMSKMEIVCGVCGVSNAQNVIEGEILCNRCKKIRDFKEEVAMKKESEELKLDEYPDAILAEIKEKKNRAPDAIQWNGHAFEWGIERSDGIMEYFPMEQASMIVTEILHKYTKRRKKVEFDALMCKEPVEEITQEDVDKAIEKVVNPPARGRMLMVPAGAAETINDAPEEIRDSPWMLYNYLIEKGYRCWFE